MSAKLPFTCDYANGAHPDVMRRLMETNDIYTAGYGLDEYTESAAKKIRAACCAPDADVFLLVGGTQTNATVIDALLKSYQGVIAAQSGHVSVHEAGAIEAGGHKVLTMPHTNGKISASDLESLMQSFWSDDTHDHMVMPGMVYISQPTEYGTLYTLSELTDISAVCRKYELPLYVDGARLAYALACPENDVTLSDLARLCDVFYIGGTKCGTLFGEAVVIPKHGYIPHFFTIVKQHGALLAKGRLLGVQFDALFTDGLYDKIGQAAIQAANMIVDKLNERGIETCYGSPTNQIFFKLSEEAYEKLQSVADVGIWQRCDAGQVIVRCVTSWSTTLSDAQALCRALEEL